MADETQTFKAFGCTIMVHRRHTSGGVTIEIDTPPDWELDNRDGSPRVNVWVNDCKVSSGYEIVDEVS